MLTISRYNECMLRNVVLAVDGTRPELGKGSAWFIGSVGSQLMYDFLSVIDFKKVAFLNVSIVVY